ncbi:hypothetical protein VOLCADRAFT_107179 [Volvox carteri f. nagariensis]|uniref:Uncharacterized protein n=1 Tax=Volvox carteri f. nagariensis TaxID=3068 RepID=D8UCF4_VOLCA|nr:uncharacterized protein VOLCADRAFT_107179 [Volvox carteri f. nagariensis]EFJ42483.1 hypothetical protein VOLCADRAFT_107179 [Volvox carteri f. nagariensis]|eukprot:XP_002956339.1 hypothetical protein VOLCADRAFT_107179 [Volvox carteri f. nagariensis]
MSTHFHVTHALTRGLARTFEDALALEPPAEPIDVKVAYNQHEKYNELLKSIIPNVLEIPADDSCPDCVFIEDTALVISESHAVITRPGAPSRQREPDPVVEALQSLGISHIDRLCDPATLDGGDVLVLPWAVLVGTSRRTNKEAVAQLEALLKAAGGPPLYVFSVQDAAIAAATTAIMPAATAADGKDPHTLLVADSPMGHALADQIRAVLPHHHQFHHQQQQQQQETPSSSSLSSPSLSAPAPATAAGAGTTPLDLIFVPDTLAANVLSAGAHVVMQAGFPASEAIVRAACEARGMTLHTLSMSELAKADGALTCCSLLFRAPRKAEQ